MSNTKGDRSRTLALRAACMAMALMLAAGAARAQPWTVRTVDWVINPALSGPFRANADVMVDEAGNISVVAALMTGSLGGGGVPVFSQLTAGQTFFNERSSEVPFDPVELSGQLGPDGLVQIAGRTGITPRRFYGQDFGDWVPGGVQADLLDFQGVVTNAGPTLALNHQGIPTVAWYGLQSGMAGYFATDFNPASGQWTNPTLLQLGLGGPNRTPPAVAFDSQNRRITAMSLPINPVDATFQVQRLDDTGSAVVYTDSADADTGVAAVVGPNDESAYAYVHNGNVKVAVQTAQGITVHELTGVGSLPQLLPRSLTFDANGDLAIVIGHRHPTSQDVVLARYIGGSWQTENLPVRGVVGTLTFDDANNPYIAATSADAIALIGQNITPLLKGDFQVDNDVDVADVPEFVRAVKNQSTYRSSFPDMGEVDFQVIGDYDADFDVDEDDARTFLDSLVTTPVAGIGGRSAGFVAFDNANVAQGEGDDNFFNTTLASGAAYEPGDSAGDLTGPTAGVADQTIDADDIDYLFAQINSGTPDLRADLLFNGAVDFDDATWLIEEILETWFGDANLDGQVDATDLGILAGNWQGASGWAGADFNGDGLVNLTDLGVIATNWQNGVPGPPAPSFTEAWAAAQQSVPEPTTAALLGIATVGLLSRRRR